MACFIRLALNNAGAIRRGALLACLLAVFLPLKGVAYAAPSTQGIASLTDAEVRKLAGFYKEGKASDKVNILGRIVRHAQKALQKEPEPFSHVVTSGSQIKTGKTSNSSQAHKQSNDVYMLALAYAITGEDAYFEKARHYLLRWAQVHQPEGDSVAAVKFVPMFRAYDLIRGRLAAPDREVIDGWLSKTGLAVLADQEIARKEGAARGVNNHRSHALLILAVIGCTTGQERFIHYVTDKSGFLDHIGKNLATFDTEPPGAGLDYHQRKAYHYVAYNLRALGQLAVLLDRLAHLPGNPYAIHYRPYTVGVSGASLIKTLRILLPYAAGEKTHATEFEGTHNKNDLKRLENGSLHAVFNRKDAVPALESAAYFFAAIKAPSSGKRYFPAQLIADILADMGKPPSSPTYPTVGFLINRVRSPYL